MIESRETARGKVIYKANLKKSEPEEIGDCRDRIDDFQFMALAVFGLIEDSRERGLFTEEGLGRLDEAAARLLSETAELSPAIPGVEAGPATAPAMPLKQGAARAKKKAAASAKVRAKKAAAKKKG